jgi:hypothetical protein
LGPFIQSYRSANRLYGSSVISAVPNGGHQPLPSGAGCT